jgi:signal transduction histidine kinase
MLPCRTNAGVGNRQPCGKIAGDDASKVGPGTVQFRALAPEAKRGYARGTVSARDLALPGGRSPAFGPPLRGLARRIHLLSIALVLGAALVIVSSRNYADARRAGESFSEKQGVVLFLGLGIEPKRAPNVLKERFGQIIASRGDVTHLAFWSNGRKLFEAGRDAFPELTPTPGQIQMHEGRARMSFDTRLFNAAEQSDRGPWPAPADALDNVVVMQFEPVGTLDFARRALLSLWLSCGAAMLLTSAAVVLWRQGERGDRMQAELVRQRHLATLGMLSAVLAHELKNPLTALKGNAQLLAENATTDRTRAQSERVVGAVVRLEAVIKELLEFSRSGAIHRVDSSPSAVLRAAIEATHPDRIDAVLASAPPEWRLDGGRIQQVLVNLLENAAQVTPAGQRIRASVTEESGYLVYSVCDAGPGVPQAEREKIFEPFYTTRLHGTGLGLAVAKHIVELHQGRIDVDAATSGGAVFRVRIPPQA